MMASQANEQVEYSEVTVQIRVPTKLWEKFSTTSKAAGWQEGEWLSWLVGGHLEHMFDENPELLSCFMKGPQKEDHE